jgi:hypothetical protein
VKNAGGGKPLRLVVDGKPLEGTLVPWAEAGAVVAVECEA